MSAETLVQRLEACPRDRNGNTDTFECLLSMGEAAQALRKQASEIERLTRDLSEYQRRSELNPLSGLSTTGINIWGDKASIGAVRTALHRSAQLDEYRQSFDAAASRLKDQAESAERDKAALAAAGRLAKQWMCDNIREGDIAGAKALGELAAALANMEGKNDG